MVEENGVKVIMEKPVVPISPPEKIGPKRGGLMKRTLRELETLGIHLKHMFSVDNISINLSWIQVIRAVNYNAENEVLRWDNTFEEALGVIELFLF